MANIPSKGTKVVPFAAAFCEWLVSFAGKIATCVECSEMVNNHVATGGRLPVSAAEDKSLTQDLINRGDASADGATNYLAASRQMTRLGIPNTAYGADWFGSHDFVPVVKAAIDRGVAVLYGLYAAYKLYDDWTGKPEDAGVYGHGICIVGYDATGAVCADPNTVQAESGNFTHYTWANLKAAGGSYPSMVVPEVGMQFPAGVPTGWTDDKQGDITVDGTLTAPNGVTVVQGFRKHVLESGWNPGNYPLAEHSYAAWDNGSIEPGNAAIGAGDRQDFRLSSLGWTKDRGVYEIWVGQDIVALEHEVQAVKAQLAAALAKPAMDPTVVSALVSAAQVLTPLGSACDEVAAALKKVQS